MDGSMQIYKQEKIYQRKLLCGLFYQMHCRASNGRCVTTSHFTGYSCNDHTDALDCGNGHPAGQA